ncbi:uncharacterized protein TNCV_3450021 [Trichonephila clavipes]|uniref:Uncharacterized protein n=1 Tax=Trichonephila clavipes TaxID=2585209 RepID=A0A8X6WL63_TRICX|nr:uncharacterized protein TNCV_3450021 [Trichonephila clavipes]
MLPSVWYLLAKVHGTIAICMDTAGGFDEEYCGQMMVVSRIVWQFHEHCWSLKLLRNAITSISTAMQGARASFKHGRPARAQSSNFPVSSKRLTSFKRPAVAHPVQWLATLTAVSLRLGLNPGEDMDVCKCIVPSWHGGTLNSRRAVSPLVMLLEGEERW